MNTRFVLVTFSIILLCASIALGSGFSVYEQGATSTGMASAFAAKADDATAVFFNPAGISQLEGTTISLGLSVIPPESEFTDPYGGHWETADQTFLVPNLYLTHELNESFDLGFGVFTPYGLGMDWSENEDFIYRYLVKDVTIQSTYVQPVLSYSLNENWAIAAGALYVISNVEYVAAIDMSEISAGLSNAMGMDINLEDSEMTLDGDNGSGSWGYSLALHGKMDRLHLGLAYRSSIECEYDGEATFNIPASPYGSTVDSIVKTYLPDTGGDTKIEMPATVQVGLGFDITDKLYAEFDVLWHQWSTYDSLDIDFEADVLPDVAQRKDWDDVMSYRLGLYYQATDALSLFGGYYYDETPVPDDTLDPILPCADRNSFQFGAGYDFGQFEIQGAYMYLMFDDRETTTNYRGINGDYEGRTHILSAQVSYTF